MIVYSIEEMRYKVRDFARGAASKSEISRLSDQEILTLYYKQKQQIKYLPTIPTLEGLDIMIEGV
jgi:hypothetical protein